MTTLLNDNNPDQDNNLDQDNNPDQDNTLMLSGSLTADQATQIKQDLMKTLDSSSILNLGFQEVTVIDVSFLQLLQSTYLTANRSGKAIQLKQPVPELLIKFTIMNGYQHHPWWNVHNKSM